jgi:predicted MPP superfamily phosphohydrolase
VRRLPLLAVLALLHAALGFSLLGPFSGPERAVGAVALLALYALLASSLRTAFTHDVAHRWLRWAGLIAIGFFSSLFVLGLLRVGLLLVALAFPHGPWLARDSALAVPLLAALATAAGFANARRRPAVREVEVPIEGLPPALDGFTVVQISDLHVGPTIRRSFVQKVVETANGLKPDAIVVTGDSVDGRVSDLRPHIEPFAQLRATHGVFGVTGNHEYYSGAEAWVRELRRLGVEMLMNEHRVLRHQGASLVLAGVTDYSAGHFEASQASDPQQALQGAPVGMRPRILLAHQPRSADAAERAGADLQLSGHTHGGQFLPWRWFVPLQQPYVAGLHRHGKMWIYTSRGTGYWGPPKRLGAPSEVTRLTLRPA